MSKKNLGAIKDRDGLRRKIAYLKRVLASLNLHSGYPVDSSSKKSPKRRKSVQPIVDELLQRGDTRPKNSRSQNRHRSYYFDQYSRKVYIDPEKPANDQITMKAI